MARDQAAMRSHIETMLPGWARESEAIFDSVITAFAAIFADVESRQEAHHDRTMTLTADGSWLDELGAERSVFRYDGESDESFRPRVRQFTIGVTLPAIKKLVELLLLFGEAEIEEHLPDGDWKNEPIPGRSFYKSGGQKPLATSEYRGFTVRIPDQFTVLHDRSFTVPNGDTGAYRGNFLVRNGTGKSAGMFIEARAPKLGALYDQIYRVIDRARACGVSFQFIVT